MYRRSKPITHSNRVLRFRPGGAWVAALGLLLALIPCASRTRAAANTVEILRGAGSNGPIDGLISTEGKLLTAVNLGSLLASLRNGVSFTGAGLGTGPSGANWSVVAGQVDADLGGFSAIDPLFFSELWGANPVTLTYSNLNPANAYLVQVFHGEPRSCCAANFETNDFVTSAGIVPVPAFALGNSLGGENPPNVLDRVIVQARFSGISSFTYRMRNSATRGASIAGFQVRSVGVKPAVTASSVDAITQTSALLQGAVDTMDLATAAYFRYGTTPSYGSFSTTNTLDGTNLSVAVSAAISGLAPATTYYFALTAANGAGAALGAESKFTTLRFPVTNVVTSLADSGPGSLRQAIAGSVPGDVITFSTSGTITLASGELAIPRSLAIRGPGAADLVVSGDHLSRVFRIAAGAVVSISGVSVADGYAPGGGGGGGILNDGTLTLSGVRVIGNRAGDALTPTFLQPTIDGSGCSGGGVFSSGPLTADLCTFVGNNASESLSGLVRAAGGGSGGAIYGTDTLNLDGCTFDSNTAGNGGGASANVSSSAMGGGGGSGGAIYGTGTLNLNGCTFNSNAAGFGGHASGGGFKPGTGGSGGSGGAIYSVGQLNLNTCTLSLNSAGSGGFGGGGGVSSGTGGAGGSGGAIFCEGGVSLVSCSLNANQAGSGSQGGAGLAGSAGPSGADGSGGGVFFTEGMIRNVLIAGNRASAGPDLFGPALSQGHNLIGATDGSSGVTNHVNGDLAGTAAAPLDALLGPLRDNGGPTWTMALMPFSPAIDAGDDALAGTDQRGQPRLQGIHVDVGAYEAQVYRAPAFISLVSTLAGTNVFTLLYTIELHAWIDPTGLPGSVLFQYGSTAGYGETRGPLGFTSDTNAYELVVGSTFGAGSTFHWRVAASNVMGVAFSPDQVFTLPSLGGSGTGSGVPGDQNGDGVVSPAELEAVLSHYWPSSPWLQMTNVAGLGGTNVTFALTNSISGAFSVEYTTNFSEWIFLGPATPRYGFTDTNDVSGPQRFYRLRWP